MYLVHSLHTLHRHFRLVSPQCSQGTTQAERLSTRDSCELAAMWMLSLWKDQSVLLTTKQSLQPLIFLFSNHDCHNQVLSANYCLLGYFLHFS